MARIGVASSHDDTALRAILHACRTGAIAADVAIVVSNNSRSAALDGARDAGLPVCHISRTTHRDSSDADAALSAALRRHGVELLVLAGYNRRITGKTLEAFRNRIINVHPAPLPRFGGRGMYGPAVHRSVLASGVGASAATVHVVDDRYNHGPVVADCEVGLLEDDTPESLGARAWQAACTLCVETLGSIVSGDLDLDDVASAGAGDATGAEPARSARVGDLIKEQVGYYDKRAHEYDDFWNRGGRYDRGPERNARFFEEIEALERALDDFRPAGRVLELACGTGESTRRLLRYASSITAVDSSPESVKINRSKVGDPRVRYVVADMFSWEPDEQYDVVYFSWWISHVPLDRFDSFWDLVERSLAPGGRVFFVDDYLREPPPDAVLEPRDRRFLRRLEATLSEPHDLDLQTIVRRLNDGRAFRAVKVYWFRPRELEQRLAALGWDVTVSVTPHEQMYDAHGRRAGDPA